MKPACYVILGELVFAKINKHGDIYTIKLTCESLVTPFIENNRYGNLCSATDAVKYLVPQECRAFIKVIVM